MGRLLVLVILIVVAVWLVRRALRRIARKDEMRDGARDLAPEQLVRCAHCGVLLPRAEARQAAGALYCSADHATKGPGAR